MIEIIGALLGLAFVLRFCPPSKIDQWVQEAADKRAVAAHNERKARQREEPADLCSDQ